MKWFRLAFPVIVMLAVQTRSGATQEVGGSRSAPFGVPTGELLRPPGSATPESHREVGGAPGELDQLVLPWGEPGRRRRMPRFALVYRSEGVLPLAVGVERLMDAFDRAGFAARTAPLAQFPSRGPLRHPSAVTIVVGASSELARLFPRKHFVVPPADSFRIEMFPGRTLVALGGNGLGSAYGCIALAEKVATDADLAGEELIEGTPSFAVRAVTIPASVVRRENEAWLHSDDYWRSLFGDMVATRWNTVFVPHALVRTVEGTAPGAAEPVMRLAREFDLRMVVDLEGDADEEEGVESRSLLDGVEGLRSVQGVRFRISAAEIRGGSPGLVGMACDRFPGLQIHVRLPSRVEPAEVKAWLGALGDARVYAWLGAETNLNRWKEFGAGDPHLAGMAYECPHVPTHMTRWGDPNLVARSLESAQANRMVGICMPGDEWCFGPDRIGASYHVEQCRNWTYLHEKQWFRFWLWGKCAYDGTLSMDDAEAVFRSRFGEAVGPAMLRSQVSASRILATLSDFFFELRAPGIFLEGSWLGVVHPIPGDAGDPLVDEGLLSSQVLSRMTVNQEKSIGVPEMVGMRMAGLEVSRDRRVDPLELAERLTDLSHDCRESARVAYQQEYSPLDIRESRSYDLELQFMANLGRYYAWQLWAAVEGCARRGLSEEGTPDVAGEAIEGIAREWDFLTRLGDVLYLPLRTEGERVFHWRLLAGRLREESAWIEDSAPGVVARSVSWKVLGPIPLETRHLESIERICSSTAPHALGIGPDVPQRELAWREATVRVLEATPEGGLPLWAERVNHYARFVNLQQTYPRAIEGVGFAWRQFSSDEAYAAMLECALGEPEKIWVNGKEVYRQSEAEKGFPGHGIPIQIEVGENHLVFRSDLERGKRAYWGAALHVRRAEGT